MRQRRVPERAGIDESSSQLAYPTDCQPQRRSYAISMLARLETQL